MKYHLAQLNIAKFIKPIEDPANSGFIKNVDKINALAEAHAGFVWRLVDENLDPDGPAIFSAGDLAINLSVWSSVELLSEFVYRNVAHREIMRKRTNWFSELNAYLVLWWMDAGHRPNLAEAKDRLDILVEKGPSNEAFNFKHVFPAPRA